MVSIASAGTAGAIFLYTFLLPQALLSYLLTWEHTGLSTRLASEVYAAWIVMDVPQVSSLCVSLCVRARVHMFHLSETRSYNVS